ncbi:MFS transporter [Sphingomonas sp.]|uniref:MFS transporter n=1 Tax=Sphingomonas sp. TaxID=28214 RepID=UPI001EC335BE|nr:MFS transporter [Sphingomonas sp.]MBX3593771.1 MFS transporter [Sphingomonas sp.]
MSRNPVTGKELRAVGILSLGFGLVGIDRFLISTMYPTIARDLHLDYGDIGTITGALALAWGIAALLMGNLSDRIGQRRVLVGSLIVFSLLIGGSGLAAGLGGLVLVRVVMGFADGAFTPASIAATVNASPPERHGRNVGLQQTMLVLFGLGLSPLLVGFLLREGVDWRYIFLIFTIPGLLIAWATWRIIPDAPKRSTETNSFQDWKTVFGHRNIRLLMAGMFCWLTCLITTSAFLPNYFVDHLKLNELSMGVVMSAIGFGAMAGTILLSALSDLIGRKPVMILSSIGALGALIALNMAGPNMWLLFAILFLIHFCNNALITLTVGPIATETVPIALMTTASGMVIAAGELLGGGLAPILAGQTAQAFGIDHILWFPIAAMAIGVLISLALRETHPEKLRP